jgi:hypothetical protein
MSVNYFRVPYLWYLWGLYDALAQMDDLVGNNDPACLWD